MYFHPYKILLFPGGLQRGVALIVALLVFALVAALMVGLQREFNLQLQRSANIIFDEQGWNYLRGAEALAAIALRLDTRRDAYQESPVDSLHEVWAQPTAPYPIDDIGWLQGKLADLQGRFNINGLPINGSQNWERDEGQRQSRLSPYQQLFVRLLRSLEGVDIEQMQAVQLVEKITDFIDMDRVPRVEGAEDEAYRQTGFPYRAPNRPIASISELRAVQGITPEIYAALAPNVTVWPSEGQSINVLTATFPLLRALNVDGSLEPLPLSEGKRLLLLREEGQIDSVDSFLEDLLFLEQEMNEIKSFLVDRSEWFLLEASVTIADRERRLYSVLHRDESAVTPVFRTEGEL